MSAIKREGQTRSPQPSVSPDQADGHFPRPHLIPLMPILGPIAEIDKIDRQSTRKRLPSTAPGGVVRSSPAS
jgi:hypothetical protein